MRWAPLCRYNVYIESGAWATNFKQKLASGSPVFAIDPQAPEFFSRALRPGVHYAPLRVSDMCNQTVATVRPCRPASLRMHAERHVQHVCPWSWARVDMQHHTGC